MCDFADVEVADIMGLTYIAGACQAKLVAEYGCDNVVRICPVYLSSSREAILGIREDALRYFDNRNAGVLTVPALAFYTLMRYAQRVFEDFQDAGLFGSCDTGPVVPVLVKLAIKKFDICGFKFLCDENCEACGGSNLLQRSLIYLFRARIGRYLCKLNAKVATGVKAPKSAT